MRNLLRLFRQYPECDPLVAAQLDCVHSIASTPAERISQLPGLWTGYAAGFAPGRVTRGGVTARGLIGDGLS